MIVNVYISSFSRYVNSSSGSRGGFSLSFTSGFSSFSGFSRFSVFSRGSVTSFLSFSSTVGGLGGVLSNLLV